MSKDGGYNLRKRKAEETSGSKQSKKTAEKVENGILAEIMAELKNIRKKIDENQKENELKFEEIRSKLEEHGKLQTEKSSEISRELSSVHQAVFRSLPIRDAILGKWKMVRHENFEGFEKKMKEPFARFSEDVEYRMDGTSTQQIGGVYPNQNEKLERLYVEDNQLIAEFENGMRIDRHVIDGKLIQYTDFDGESWKRIYERVQ